MVGLVGIPSSSTATALMAGVLVSMKGVCVATAEDVVCGNVVVALAESVGGEMGVVSAMISFFFSVCLFVWLGTRTGVRSGDEGKGSGGISERGV